MNMILKAFFVIFLFLYPFSYNVSNVKTFIDDIFLDSSFLFLRCKLLHRKPMFDREKKGA